MTNLDLWQKREYTGMRPGLERIARFLGKSGIGTDPFPVIHVAGTNGKGSTARMIASALEAGGYRVGLYTSPHLVRINERIQINSVPVSGRDLARLVRRYSEAGTQAKLTFFEFMTGLAFACFKERTVDIAVLETGLGGRFDATNIVSRPLVSAITEIDYDHQRFLGRTMPEIASEKAGIIKRGCPVVSGARRPAARKVIEATARRLGSPLSQIERDFACKTVATGKLWRAQSLRYSDGEGATDFKIRLPGEHQARNAALAVRALRIAAEQGFDLGRGELRRGLLRARWPGRFDARNVKLGGRERTVILDGAHNPAGAATLVATVQQSFGQGFKTTIIFGVLGDKDYRAIIRCLQKVTSRVIIVPVPSPRSAGADEIEEVWKRFLAQVNIGRAASVDEALKRIGNEKTIIITGSLYLVGHAIRKFEANNLK